MVARILVGSGKSLLLRMTKLTSRFPKTWARWHLPSPRTTRGSLRTCLGSRTWPWALGLKELVLKCLLPVLRRIISCGQNSTSTLTSEPAESILTLPPSENAPVTLQHGFTRLFGEFSGVPDSVHSKSLRQSRNLPGLATSSERTGLAAVCKSPEESQNPKTVLPQVLALDSRSSIPRSTT